MVQISALFERWPTMNTLLDEALTLPEQERGAWLDKLLGVDPEQRTALRDLLGLNSGSAHIIDELPQFDLAARDASAGSAGLAAGQLIGPYLLIAPLGEGGMGSVWLAERADQQPRRKVAIKLPHIGWAPGLTARLERERDILASLEHPNIARLYDAGVDQLGRPYLAMEYVDGESITEFAEVRKLSLRERLVLLQAVAAAVAYAHTRLVVHRDLKPSNILVTRDGEVRLLDFGIAKLMNPNLEGEDLTKLSGRAVTPEYSSPEQFRGEPIGTPSDVYSLGVVTYELLAGVRPYRLKDAHTSRLDEAILRVQPAPLSRAAGDPARRKQLRGDLEAIVHKALKKAPQERYQTVADFSADLGRYLNDLPIHARPDGLGYRTRKFVARNTLQVGAGAMVLGAVVVGASVALWQAHQARLEAARADQVKEFVLSIFADADTDSGAGATTTAADLLGAAQARVQTELATRPDVQVELMAAIAYGLAGQGRLQQAHTLSQNSVELADRSLGADHPRSIAAKVIYGEILQNEGNAEQAVAVLTPLIVAARSHGLRADVVNALRNRSAAYIDVGKNDLAVADAEDAIAALPALVTVSDKRLAETTWGAYANALGFARKPGAVAAARHALDLAMDISGGRPTRDVEDIRTTLTGTMLDEGDYLGAIAMGSLASEETEKLLGAEHPILQYLYSFMGIAKTNIGDVEGAIAEFRLEMKVVDAEGPSSQHRGAAQCDLGRALAMAHRDAEAEPMLANGVRALHDVGRENGAIVERCQSTYALLLARSGRLPEAAKWFERLDSAKDLTPEQHAVCQTQEAEFRSLDGRHDAAIALATSAAEQLRGSKAALSAADANYTLGKILIAAGRAAQAVAPLQAAVDQYGALPFPHPPDRDAAETALTRAKHATPGT